MLSAVTALVVASVCTCEISVRVDYAQCALRTPGFVAYPGAQLDSSELVDRAMLLSGFDEAPYVYIYIYMYI